jgi:hypothetical protein
MRLCACILFGLFSFSAAATPPAISTAGRLDGAQVSMAVSPAGLGVGFLRPYGASLWGLELQGAPSDGVYTLHATQVRPWVKSERFSLSWQNGAFTRAVSTGTPDFALGLQTGLYAGVGGEHFEAFSGMSFAVDAFARDFGVRLMPRGVFGLRGRMGKLLVRALLLAGQDFEEGTFATWRADAQLVLGWQL